MIGESVGPYRVTEKIGAGGMGEVFRAQDVRLGRSVTVKFLPPEGRSAEALERFQREARAASALNHPNICTVYDLGQHRGQPYMVMEYLEGKTIAEVIGGRPVSIATLLDVGIQVTAALSAAHGKGILHRDIKPSNLFLTDTGHVKVLDFGLAKLTEHVSPEGSASSILTRDREHLTSPGAALGTVVYMSPEQALGKELDGRTDIFSLGVVLYEMATGRRPFIGATTAAVFDSILHGAPTAAVRLNPEVPQRLDEIIDRALEKDPDFRYQSMTDLGADLKRLRRDMAAGIRSDLPKRPLRIPRAAWAVAAIASGAAVWLLRPVPSPPATVVRFALDLPPEQSISSWYLDDPAIALAPEGDRLLHVGGGKLYLRRIDQVESTVVPGTEGAFQGFFSPDGRWIGFLTGSELKKIPAAGGSPVSLAEAPNPWGASWGDDGNILYAPSGISGLSRISASGGTATEVTKPDASRGEVSHRWPEFLPGGRSAVFTIWKGTIRESEIALLSVETGEYRVLLRGGSSPRYSPTGHLVYASEGKLMAASFDLGRLELTGDSLPILEGVSIRDSTGAGQFSISRNGSLAFVEALSPERTLLWVDRKGEGRPLTETRLGFASPRLSPDGRRLALTALDRSAVYLYLFDFERDALSHFGSGTRGRFPVWTSDGTKIAFESGSDIVWQSADGSGAPETLITGTTGLVPISFSRDGKFLAYRNHDPATLADIWLFSLEGDERRRPLVQSEIYELTGAFSPDDRWFAYVASELGELQVYIRPFPGPGERHLVSTGGGAQPVWARSGREIFYRGQGRMMVVTVETDPSLRLSKPKALFDDAYFKEAEDVYGTTQYDVAPDGEHFIMIRDESRSARVQVVLHWTEELKRQIASGRP